MYGRSYCPAADRAALRRARAFSLLEVIVSFALLLLLLTLMFSFLIPTLRAAARGEMMVEMEQEATTALQRMCDDVAQSAPGGLSMNQNIYRYVTANEVSPPLTPSTPPIVFSVEKLNEVCTSSNGQSWCTKYLSVYEWDTAGGDLIHRYFGRGVCGCTLGLDCKTLPCDMPGIISQCQLCTVAANPNLKSQVLATGVTSFAVDYPTADSKQICPPTIQTQCGYQAVPITVYISLQRYAATGSRAPLNASFSRTMGTRDDATSDIAIPTGCPGTTGSTGSTGP